MTSISKKDWFSKSCKLISYFPIFLAFNICQASDAVPSWDKLSEHEEVGVEHEHADLMF